MSGTPTSSVFNATEDFKYALFSSATMMKMTPNRITPRLWLALKPTHAFHIDISLVRTGLIRFIASVSPASRASNLLVVKVYNA